MKRTSPLRSRRGRETVPPLRRSTPSATGIPASGTPTDVVLPALPAGRVRGTPRSCQWRYRGTDRNRREACRADYRTRPHREAGRGSDQVPHGGRGRSGCPGLSPGVRNRAGGSCRRDLRRRRRAVLDVWICPPGGREIRGSYGEGAAALLRRFPTGPAVPNPLRSQRSTPIAVLPSGGGRNN